MIDAILPVLIGIGKGICYGAISAFIGYAKNETLESFDPYKAVKTVIVGGVVGGVMGGTGMDLVGISNTIGQELGIPGAMVETFLMTAIVSFADRIVKIVARRTDLGAAWNKIKDFLSSGSQ